MWPQGRRRYHERGERVPQGEGPRAPPHEPRPDALAFGKPFAPSSPPLGLSWGPLGPSWRPAG
eukprot:1071862-Pyramimonas_sp.AAC.1